MVDGGKIAIASSQFLESGHQLGVSFLLLFFSFGQRELDIHIEQVVKEVVSMSI